MCQICALGPDMYALGPAALRIWAYRLIICTFITTITYYKNNLIYITTKKKVKFTEKVTLSQQLKLQVTKLPQPYMPSSNFNSKLFVKYQYSCNIYNHHTGWHNFTRL